MLDVVRRGHHGLRERAAHLHRDGNAGRRRPAPHGHRGARGPRFRAGRRPRGRSALRRARDQQRLDRRRGQHHGPGRAGRCPASGWHARPAGPGARWGRVAAELRPMRLAISSGDSGDSGDSVSVAWPPARHRPDEPCPRGRSDGSDRRGRRAGRGAVRAPPHHAVRRRADRPADRGRSVISPGPPDAPAAPSPP